MRAVGKQLNITLVKTPRNMGHFFNAVVGSCNKGVIDDVNLTVVRNTSLAIGPATGKIKGSKNIFITESTQYTSRSRYETLNGDNVISLLNVCKVWQESRIRLAKQSLPNNSKLTANMVDLNVSTRREKISYVNGKTYVAKPIRSSLSIGVFKFTNTPKTSIEGVLNTISKVWTKDIDTKTGISICDKYGVSLNNEFFSRLAKSPQNDYLICDYVDNIKNEYRYFTDAFGDVFRVMSRERFVDDLGFATPVEGIDLVSEADGDLRDIHKQICGFIKKLDIPLSGVDVFVTKEGQWGIFEFSPNFSILELDNSFVLDAIKSVIKLAYNK